MPDTDILNNLVSKMKTMKYLIFLLVFHLFPVVVFSQVKGDEDSEMFNNEIFHHYGQAS